MPNVRLTWQSTLKNIYKQPWIQSRPPKFSVQEFCKRRLQIHSEGNFNKTVEPEQNRTKALCWPWTGSMLCASAGWQISCLCVLWPRVPQKTGFHSAAESEWSVYAEQLQTIRDQIRWKCLDFRSGQIVPWFLEAWGGGQIVFSHSHYEGNRRHFALEHQDIIRQLAGSGLVGGQEWRYFLWSQNVLQVEHKDE